MAWAKKQGRCKVWAGKPEACLKLGLDKVEASPIIQLFMAYSIVHGLFNCLWLIQLFMAYSIVYGLFCTFDFPNLQVYRSI